MTHTYRSTVRSFRIDGAPTAVVSPPKKKQKKIDKRRNQTKKINRPASALGTRESGSAAAVTSLSAFATRVGVHHHQPQILNSRVGASSIEMKVGMGYVIPMRISETFVHKTGLPASGEPEVKRLVAIISGHVLGESIRTCEHDLLEKGSYLSCFYDYAYVSPGEKKINYINLRPFSLRR